MAEYLQAPPRRKALGLLADALTSGQEALNTVNLPYVGGLGGLLFGQAPQYLQDVSYGMPAFRGGNVATGGLGTLTPDTRMLDVATLPFVGAGAAKAGQVGAKTLGKEVARQVETGTGLLGSNVMNPRANIVPVDVARQFDMPTTLPNKTEFTEAVSNTPGTSITPEGLLVNVSRFQKPEQELAESVRTGIFYLPTGSQQAKYYKGKGSSGGAYGGTQEVVGDTMVVEEKFMANYFLSPGVSQGGRLLISKNEIFFRPHMLNIGDLSNKYLKINEIISFEKPAFPLFLKIHTKDNRIMFLSTWSRNKIIESIRRRQALII